MNLYRLGKTIKTCKLSSQNLKNNIARKNKLDNRTPKFNRVSNVKIARRTTGARGSYF